MILKMKEKEKCMINMLIQVHKVSRGQSLWAKGSKSEFCFIIKTGEFMLKGPVSMITEEFTLKQGSFLGDFLSLLKNEPC